MTLTVISAGRGHGKTTHLREYTADRTQAGHRVGGVAAPAVFEDGRRIGYDLLDLRTGDRRLLARTGSALPVGPGIGPFRFDPDALAAGQTAIVAAVRDGLDVIAIDEVGPLEWSGQGWASALTLALAECRAPQELIVVVRAELRAQLPNRFPSPQWATARLLVPGGGPD